MWPHCPQIILTEKHKQTLTQFWINMLKYKHTHVYALNNNKMLCVCTSDHICTSTDIHTHTDVHSLTCCTPMLRALICGLCRGEWQEGRRRGKRPLGVLIMAPLLPLAVTIPRGGQDKRKAMFHLCCLGISNSKGSKRRETAYCYIGGRKKIKWCFLFLRFSLFASFAAVFKIRHLNKSVLMASRREKRHNLITVTVLFNELKASGSDLLSVYYFVVERYMWQNGARVREWGWMLLLWKSSVALPIVFCDLHLPECAPGFFIRPLQGNAAPQWRSGVCQRHLGR